MGVCGGLMVSLMIKVVFSVKKISIVRMIMRFICVVFFFIFMFVWMLVFFLGVSGEDEVMVVFLFVVG